jgi:hypothetical protein
VITHLKLGKKQSNKMTPIHQFGIYGGAAILILRQKVNYFKMVSTT